MSTDATKTKQPFFTQEQLAQRWQVSEQLLRLDRSQGVGCPYYKMGRLVRYKVTDILEYEASCKVATVEKQFDETCEVARNQVEPDNAELCGGTSATNV